MKCVFGIAVAVMVVIWKKLFYKSTFNWGWFEKIGVWLKLWLKLRLKKSSLMCLVKNAFEIKVIK